MPTQTKKEIIEQPIKKTIPEIDIILQKQQQQQQQQQQNEQEKNKFYALEKGLKATKKSYSSL